MTYVRLQSHFTSTKMVYIVFHSTDLDGWASAVLAKKYCESVKLKYSFVPFNYSDNSNKAICLLLDKAIKWSKLNRQTVFWFVDCCPLPSMIEDRAQSLFTSFVNFLICDHHIPALNALEKVVEAASLSDSRIYFENRFKALNKRSGVNLTYEAINDNQLIPNDFNFLNLVSVYDTGQSKHRLFRKALDLQSSIGLCNRKWQKMIPHVEWLYFLERESFIKYLSKFEVVSDYVINSSNGLLASAAKHEFSIEVNGRNGPCTALVVNAPGLSTLYPLKYNRCGIDVIIAYSIKESKEVHIKITSTSSRFKYCHFVAQQIFQGGGHPMAAGASCSLTQFVKFLKDTRICT